MSVGRVRVSLEYIRRAVFGDDLYGVELIGAEVDWDSAELVITVRGNDVPHGNLMVEVTQYRETRKLVQL